MTTPSQPGNEGNKGKGDPHTFSQDFQFANVSARVPEKVARGVFSTGVLVLQGAQWLLFKTVAYESGSKTCRPFLRRVFRTLLHHRLRLLALGSKCFLDLAATVEGLHAAPIPHMA